MRAFIFSILAAILFVAPTCAQTGSGQFPPSSTGASQLHSITFTITGANGGAIATGALKLFPPTKYSCTINEVDVSGDQSGSITVDIWKVNAAIPTSSNKISASDPATLSSAQSSTDTALTGWTKAVSVGDKFGGTIVTASTVTVVTITIWCQ